MGKLEDTVLVSTACKRPKMFALLLMVLPTVFAPDRALADDCDVWPEARVCAASYPWKTVVQFPWGSYQKKPEGEAVAFHLDGRGVGIVQRLDKDAPPFFQNSRDLADWWAQKFFVTGTEEDADRFTDREDWETGVGTIDGAASGEKKVRFKLDGRPTIMRASFVTTEVGELMVWSMLNERIDSEAGAYLHQGLKNAVSLATR